MNRALFTAFVIVSMLMVVVGLSVLLSTVISGSLLYVACAIIGIIVGYISSYAITG